jgi:PHO85 cyclin-6/7
MHKKRQESAWRRLLIAVRYRSLEFPSYPLTGQSQVGCHFLSIQHGHAITIADANDALPKSPTSPSSPLPTHATHATLQRYSHDPIWPSLTLASHIALTTSTPSLSFHARNVPTITLEAYLLHILKYCPTTNKVFVYLLVYFDRMAKISEEATSREFIIDNVNIHCLVIAGVTVTSKFFSDVYYTNSRYAKISDLHPLPEIP